MRYLTQQIFLMVYVAPSDIRKSESTELQFLTPLRKLCCSAIERITWDLRRALKQKWFFRVSRFKSNEQRLVALREDLDDVINVFLVRYSWRSGTNL